jgi:hypothetical protein
MSTSQGPDQERAQLNVELGLPPLWRGFATSFSNWTSIVSIDRLSAKRRRALAPLTSLRSERSS